MIGAHSHAITHTQGTQHIQHLEVKVRDHDVRAPRQESMRGPGWEARSKGWYVRIGDGHFDCEEVEKGGCQGSQRKVKGQRERSGETIGAI